MNKPLLSVCVITYNHAQYIQEAIDSIFAQEVSFRWELIIADDCSTDGTRDILLAYKNKHPDIIKLVLQEKNVGPERNWLDLLDNAKSKYVLYAEGDDYFIDPTKFQRQVDFLDTHPDFSMCFHPVKVVYEGETSGDKVDIFPTPEQRFNKKTLGLNDLLLGNFIQTNSVMYRWRFAAENVNEVFPLGVAPGDWFLHLLHAAVGKIGFIDRTMAVYRRHPGGIWWDSDKNIDNIWRKYGLAHLRLYTEMSKFPGIREKAWKSITEKIRSVFYDLRDIDKRNDEKLVQAAVRQAPEATELFMEMESQSLQEMIQTNKELSGEVEKLHQAIAESERQLAARSEELRAIKNSRAWKLRNKLARLLGKPVV